MQALELLHSEFDIDLLLDINMPASTASACSR